jgi:hypothetical protein
MNFAERLIGLYLRLNGFFLMPEFTTFSTGLKNKGHAHVDLIGFRPSGSFEEHENVIFPVDSQLFAIFNAFYQDPFNSNIAVICEVRTNDEGEFPELKRQQYAADMCGFSAVPMCCDRSVNEVCYDRAGGGIRVGLTHSMRWIAARIRWLQNEGIHKSESWNWSEPALADFLVFNELTPIECEKEFKMLVQPRKVRPSRGKFITERSGALE